MLVLFDVSAWEYLRTPPQVASVDLVHDGAAATLPECRFLLNASSRLRANARVAEAAVCERLLTDLKGLSLPVHVICDESCGEYKTKLVHVHRVPKGFSSAHAESIGGGLCVPTPEAAICFQGQLRSAPSLAKMIFEACGLFSLCPQNERTRLAVGRLESAGLVSRGCVPANKRLYAYHAEDGRPLGFLDDEGEPLPWEPCHDRTGRITELWKRPPLTSVEHLAVAVSQLRGVRYLDVVARALKMSRDGAASPAEVQANMLVCLAARYGGEAWGNPKLNMRVPYTEKAKRLASREYAVADCLWPETKDILEVNGEGFHADAGGFRVETGRRPALESMGYTVLEVTPAQMRDLETLETMLENFSSQTGRALRKRTAHFLAAREELHRELFMRPYEPVWDGSRRRKNRR